MTADTALPRPLPDLISGEWLLAPDGETYHTVYRARILGAWSGGVDAEVTRSVMDEIVRNSASMGGDHLHWEDSTVVYTTDWDPDFVQRIGVNAYGYYEVPSWTWQRIDPATDRYQGVVE